MLNLHSVNMFFVIFVICISSYSTVLCDCEDREARPINSSYIDAPLVYREFLANYSVRFYCPKGQQITEISMVPTCNARNIPVYPLPDCAMRYNGTIKSTINGTKIIITWDPSPGSIGPPVTVSSVTVPSVTVPSVTVPSVTVPSVTVPSVTVPPVTEPSVTVPPVTVPPVTVPPVTEPPVTEPPVAEPPVTEPPVTVPPVTVPPVTVPPVTVPPVTEPPVTEPPVTEPPVTEPPSGNGNEFEGPPGSRRRRSMDQLIIPSLIQVYSIFGSIDAPVRKYNEVPLIRYIGYPINDEKYTHTSYMSIGRTNPVEKLTGEFVSEFCSDQSECTERFDVNNITIWHLPCGLQNLLYVNISMGLEFHNDTYKNVDGTTQWTFDVNSCNMLKCTDVGIDSDIKYYPQIDDNIKRAINGTIAICDANYINAQMNCINGNWHGAISKPLIMC